VFVIVIVFMMLIDGISVAPCQVICLVSINVINQLPVKVASDPVSITPLPEIILKTSVCVCR